MSEQQGEKKGILEILEENFFETSIQDNSKTYNHECIQLCSDEHKFEFLVQDMFLDHFFP